MCSTSPELNSPVSDKRKWIYVLKLFYLRWVNDSQKVRYPVDVKSAEFQFQLEATYASNYTNELWYSGTVCLWMTIYLYMFFPCGLTSQEKNCRQLHSLELSTPAADWLIWIYTLKIPSITLRCQWPFPAWSVSPVYWYRFLFTIS